MEQRSVTKCVFQRRITTGHQVCVAWMSATSQRTAYSNAVGCEPVSSRESGNEPSSGPA